MSERRSSVAKPSGLPRVASRLPGPRTTAPSANSATPRGLATTTATDPGWSTSFSFNQGASPGNNIPRRGSVSSRDRSIAPATTRKVTASISNPSGVRGPPVAFRGVDPNSSPFAGRTRRKSTSANAEHPTRKPSLQSSFQNFQHAKRPSIQQITTTAPLYSWSTYDKVLARHYPSVDHSATVADHSAAESDSTIQPALSGSSDDDYRPNTATSGRKSRPSLAERTVETLSQVSSTPAIRRRPSNFFEGESAGREPSRGPLSRSRTVSVSSRPGSSYRPEVLSSSRPGSSYRPEGSGSANVRSFSRPGSSSGHSDNMVSLSPFRATALQAKTPLATAKGTPSKRMTISGDSRTTRTTARSGTLGLRKTPSQSELSTTSNSRPTSRATSVEVPIASKNTSKAVGSLSARRKTSTNSLFKRPAPLSFKDPTEPEAPRLSPRSSFASLDERNLSSVSPASTAPTIDSFDDVVPVQNNKKSSAALRDQIAKAKAAKRTADIQMSALLRAQPKSPLIPTDTSFDFGLDDDPFGQKKLEDAGRKVMQSRVSTARTTGSLNISAMGLKDIPDEVFTMYDLETINACGGSWAESVDLTRFVAANNELEALDEALFPDTDPSDSASEDDSRGHQFGGLETLDLHGNMLISLPVGIRRLQVLTSLNLSQNKLTNSCLDFISQITPLRDLKLGNNLLYGQLGDAITKLEQLESLDLHGNSISSLPRNMDRLGSLRILNVNENDLVQLPFESLANLSLTELSARKNQLKGTLFSSGVHRMRHLQTLDVSMNRLTALSSSAHLDLPALHQLTISGNRIETLPAVGSWQSLSTLHADENLIAEFPEGFTQLKNLRHVDLTSNDIRVVPPEISRMENLGMLRITGNPLRDKKFTSFSTEELKAALSARLEPEFNQPPTLPEHIISALEAASLHSPHLIRSQSRSPAADLGPDRLDTGSDRFATPSPSGFHSPARQRSRSNTTSSAGWPVTRSRSNTASSASLAVTQGGILDRSATQSSTLHTVVCSNLAARQTIREVRLHNNTFSNIPMALSFFSDTLTSLSLSHNELAGEGYLDNLGTDILDLTALKELNLSSNRITSLAPLTTSLRAPNLSKLDVSFNRIVTLPTLRDFFPSLEILLINDNQLEALSDGWIRGMKVVDARNNDIPHLNPRIGLLGGSSGLERLDVTGNKFRVPRHNILDLGTEATLRWLRSRVPVADIAEWKSKAGEASEEFEI